jgi:acyl carrier protein
MNIMNQLEMLDKVRKVIETTFNCQSTPGTEYSMGAVPGWDSLGHMTLIIKLEDAFGITLPSYALPALTSVKDIVSTIAGLS